MANIKSAKKRILVTETRTARNKAIKSEVKTMVKKVYAAIDSKDQEAAKAALKAAISTLDKATTKSTVAMMPFQEKRFPEKSPVCRKLSTRWLNPEFSEEHHDKKTTGTVMPVVFLYIYISHRLQKAN